MAALMALVIGAAADTNNIAVFKDFITGDDLGFTSTKWLPVTFNRMGREVLRVTEEDYAATADTNIVLKVARVFTRLSTNTAVETPPWTFHCLVAHPPGEICNYGRPNPVERTTIKKERVASIEGKELVLSWEIVSDIAREFVVEEQRRYVSTNAPSLWLPYFR